MNSINMSSITTVHYTFGYILSTEDLSMTDQHAENN